MKTVATKTPSQSTDWDAIVVGAGPAGGVAARLLAKRGWLVLLVERSGWPREKACGGCINAAGVRLLNESGLGHLLADAPPVSRMQLCYRKRSLGIDVPRGVVVERRSFDAGLAQAAQEAGCVFRSSTHARLLPSESPACRRVLLENAAGSEIATTRIILACDGLGKPGRGFLSEEPWAHVVVAPGPRLGFSANVAIHDFPGLPPEALAMCVGTEGYVGIVRTLSGDLHMGAALLPRACHHRHGPAGVVQAILAECGQPTTWQGSPDRPFVGTGPLTSHRKIVGHGRILALGDAAGYVEPFTGEGISWAIRAAHAAVGLLPRDPAEIPNSIGSQWNHEFATRLRPRQIWCRSIRRLLNSPTMSRVAFQAACLFPRSTRLLAHKISA